MKRITTFLLSLLLVGLLALPCLAAESPYVRTDTELTEDQAEYLAVLHDAIKKNCGIEAFFVINYDYEGGDSFKTYAKDYLHSHAETDDAMIFAVSSTTYYMNALGKAGELIEDEDLGTLYEAIRRADEDGEQYTAAVQFYSALLQLLSKRKAEGAPPATTASADAAAQDDPSGATTQPAEPTKPEERVIIPGSVAIPDEIAPTRGDRLVDQADLLSPEDEAALQEKLDTISEALQFDVVIVTAKHIGSRSPMEFADDYFDYNGFGYGPDYDGVCLLISMAERDWWISTCGFGETALSDDYFLPTISPSDFTYYLKKGEYARSFNYLADVVNDFVIEAKNGEPFSRDHRYQDWKNKAIGVSVSLVLGLIVAAIVTYYKKESYVSAVHESADAGSYMVGNLKLSEKTDRFIGSYVNRTRRVHETESSSSSGRSYTSSGSHTSSSGRSHGGGGGKF